jgi:polygalacturonase
MSTYNVIDFGAAGDGQANDAAAIQRAIDACTAAGGGTVLLPAGKTFRSGTIALKSNVELHVEGGARLAGSGDWAD